MRNFNDDLAAELNHRTRMAQDAPPGPKAGGLFDPKNNSNRGILGRLLDAFTPDPPRRVPSKDAVCDKHPEGGCDCYDSAAHVSQRMAAQFKQLIEAYPDAAARPEWERKLEEYSRKAKAQANSGMDADDPSDLSFYKNRYMTENLIGLTENQALRSLAGFGLRPGNKSVAAFLRSGNLKVVGGRVERL